MLVQTVEKVVCVMLKFGLENFQAFYSQSTPGGVGGVPLISATKGRGVRFLEQESNCHPKLDGQCCLGYLGKSWGRRNIFDSN
jgi:hypothetical protein